MERKKVFSLRLAPSERQGAEGLRGPRETFGALVRRLLAQEAKRLGLDTEQQQAA